MDLWFVLLDEQPTTVNGVLIAGVLAMASLLGWVIRSAFAYQQKRIDTLENREERVLSTLVESVKTIRDMMAGVVDALKDMQRWYINPPPNRDR